MAFSEAMKIGNSNIFMALKKINGSFMSISWDFYETTGQKGVFQIPPPSQI